MLWIETDSYLYVAIAELFVVWHCPDGQDGDIWAVQPNQQQQKKVLRLPALRFCRSDDSSFFLWTLETDPQCAAAAKIHRTIQQFELAQR
jgi:hypothetical protein